MTSFSANRPRGAHESPGLDVVWGLLAGVAGLATLAAGVREIRTGRPVVRRLGTRPDTVRRHGWVCAVLGGYIALSALSRALDLSVWVDVGLLVALLALGAWAAFARPFGPPDRPPCVRYGPSEAQRR